MANNNKHTGPNVPALRFPEFSGEWRKISLQDCCSGFSYGMNAPAKSYDGINKYIRITDIDESTSIYKSDDVVSPDGLLLDEYLVNENDILFARTGASTGKTYLYNKDDGRLFYAGFLIKVNVNNNFDPYFIFSQTKTQSYRRWVEIMSTRSGQPGINSQEYASFPLCVPSKKEQAKISLLLRGIDERILIQSKIIEELKTLRSALSESLYCECDSFQELSFNEVGECYSGLSGKSGEDFGSGYPYIPYTNIFANDVIDENQFEYVQVREDESQNTVHYGDLLMTLSSETPEEVGIGSVYLGSESHLYLNSFAFGIHITRTDLVFPPYLSWIVSTKSFRKFILPFAQGSTRYNLQKTDFMKAKYRFPTLERQKIISKILSSYSLKIANEEKTLDQYKIQKQGLLEQMFI